MSTFLIETSEEDSTTAVARMVAEFLDEGKVGTVCTFVRRRRRFPLAGTPPAPASSALELPAGASAPWNTGSVPPLHPPAGVGACSEEAKGKAQISVAGFFAGVAKPLGKCREGGAASLPGAATKGWPRKTCRCWSESCPAGAGWSLWNSTQAAESELTITA